MNYFRLDIIRGGISDIILNKRMIYYIIDQNHLYPNSNSYYGLYSELYSLKLKTYLWIAGDGICPVIDSILYEIISKKLDEYKKNVIELTRMKFVEKLSKMDEEFKKGVGSLEFEIYRKKDLIEEYKKARDIYADLLNDKFVYGILEDMNPINASEYWLLACERNNLRG